MTRLNREEGRRRAAPRLEVDDGLYRSIVEALPAGVLVVGDDGLVVTANPRAEALLGYARGGLVGVAVDQVLVEQPSDARAPRPVSSLLARSPSSPSLQARRQDGGEARVELGLRKLASPEGRLTLVVMRDASERLLLERELREAREQASRLAAELQAEREAGQVELRALREASRELERLRAEWNSLIAHDLRQPLNSIAVFAQLLARQPLEWTPQAREAMAQIRQMTLRLTRMTFDLLDLSRLEAGRLSLERKKVDLCSLVQECVDRARLEAPSRLIKLRAHDQLPSIDADPDRLTQVLENLLSNAVKYGFPATPVHVDLCRESDEVSVAVTNQGKGIAPTDIGLLFERFSRAGAGKQNGMKSIGLGLAIARGLIEAHGGKIGVNSVPGGKTTFWFTLPIESG